MRKWIFVNGCDGMPIGAYQSDFDDRSQFLTWEEAQAICLDLAGQLPGVWVRAVELVDGPSAQLRNGRFTDGEDNELGGVRAPTAEELEKERDGRPAEEKANAGKN